MNISITEIINKLGYQITQRVAIPFWAGLKISEIMKDIIEVISTVEKMMEDGIIDADERRKLAAKGIHMILEKFGIIITEGEADSFIGLLVKIMDKVGALKKKK